MSSSSYQLKPGFQADAALNITDHANATLVGFPPINGSSSGASWGGGNLALHADGNVSVRVAIYTAGSGYRVSKVKLTNGDRHNLPLLTNDYRVVLHRVNEPGSGSAYPVALAVENLLAG